MAQRRPSTFAGPPCPTAVANGEDHGPLLAATQPGPTGKSFYCPSQRHDRRPATHPEGAAPASSPFFGVDEVQW